MRERIRIVIAEDQGMLRSAIATLLNLEDDLEVVGEASDGAEALALIEDKKPDVCLMDIEMPGMNGLEVARRLKEIGAETKVIIVTTFARPGYFRAALESGVHGYLLKDTPSDELAEAIRLIHNGRRVFSPDLSFEWIKAEPPLTERELQILQLAAAGKTSAEIAGALYLSNGTVRNYMSEILQKLGAKNRVEAIAIAKNNGWLP